MDLTPDLMVVVVKPGDIRFTCPECGQSITLSPEGAGRWTENGTITPKCGRHDVELIQSVIP